MYVDISSTDEKYSIIYADPPWLYQDKRCNGGAENHYRTMKLDDICSLPVERIADKNCALFLWATYPMLREALEVISAWGFVYKTIGFQWVKENRTGRGFFFGLGRWTRGNTEPCLIAIKGKPKRIDAGVSQLIFAPVARHSAKPPIVRKKIIELMGGGIPYRTIRTTDRRGLGLLGRSSARGRNARRSTSGERGNRRSGNYIRHSERR